MAGTAITSSEAIASKQATSLRSLTLRLANQKLHHPRDRSLVNSCAMNVWNLSHVLENAIG